MTPEQLSEYIGAIGTVAAAVIVAVAGGIITGLYARARDKQDKESEWRSHALELTKLEVERKLKTQELTKTPVDMRPSILDFLANYRDLKELDTLKPGALYTKIEKQRISKVSPAETPSETNSNDNAK